MNPTGTVTDTFFDAKGRAVNTYVGTNDSTTDGDDWTPGVNTGAGNNMTLVSTHLGRHTNRDSHQQHQPNHYPHLRWRRQ